MINGKIIKGIGGFYYVDTENGLYECRAYYRGQPLELDYIEVATCHEDFASPYGNFFGELAFGFNET